MTNLHAHVSTASRDCDGPMYRDYVTEMNSDEIAMQVRAYFEGVVRGYDSPVNDFSEYAFKERVLGNHVSFSPLVKVEVTVREEGFHMSEETDEGYRSADVRWCEDDCDSDAYSQRDVFAEMMGY